MSPLRTRLLVKISTVRLLGSVVALLPAVATTAPVAHAGTYTPPAPLPHGAVSASIAPINVIKGAGTDIDSPTGIAIDREGRIWAANSGGAGSVVVFGPQDTGDALPALTISGPRTRLNSPSSIALAPDGSVWVADVGTNSLLEFAPGAFGNVAPIRIITGGLTGLDYPDADAISPDGSRIAVTNRDAPPANVEQFSTTTIGDAKPLRTISERIRPCRRRWV